MKKRTISLITTIVMICTSFNLPVLAKSSGISAKKDEGIVYSQYQEQEYTLFGDETDIKSNLESGAYTIESDGSYIIDTLNTTNPLRIKAGVNARLTINDVSIQTKSGDKFAPITVESGAELTLCVKGTNNITSINNYFAGIAVYAKNPSSDFGTLIIEGDGVLNVKAFKNAPAIGTNSRNNGKTPSGEADKSTGIRGKVVINSGTVNASYYDDGTDLAGSSVSGIGSPGSRNNSSADCDIIINGGEVTAISKSNAPGIGTNGNYAAFTEKIIINGGTVKAACEKPNADGTYFPGIGTGDVMHGENSHIIINGGSVSNPVSLQAPEDPTKLLVGIKAVVRNNSDEVLRQITVYIDGAANQIVSDINGEWNAILDPNGKMYVFIGDNASSYSLLYDGKLYSNSSIKKPAAGTAEQEYELTGYTGKPCVCTPATASVLLYGNGKTLPSEVVVNKYMGAENISISAEFVPASSCEYPHVIKNIKYTLTDADNNNVDSDIAEIRNGELILNYTQTEKTLKITAELEVGENKYSVSKNLTLRGEDTLVLDLYEGNIDISEDSVNPDNLTITVNSYPQSQTFSVSKTDAVHIIQSKNYNYTDNIISVNANNVTLLLDGLNISSAAAGLVKLGAQVTDIKFLLEKDNVLKAVGEENLTISSYRQNSVTLTIEGNGSLTAESEGTAGICDLKELVVNSGTVTARGGKGGAGIGGKAEGPGFDVTVNGGYVYAYGDGVGSGIGMGQDALTTVREGTLTVNGGVVKARNGNSALKDISSKPAIINGGSVDALFESRPQTNSQDSYLSVFKPEDISGKTELSYVLGEDDSQKIQTATDENGYLYLYVPTGAQWIRIYDDNGNIYYYYSEFSDKDDKKTIKICLKNGEAKLNEFEIPGQTSASVIDHEALTVTITVPYNIKFETIIPSKIICDGRGEIDKVFDFTGENHTDTYTIVGNDQTQKTYTITLIPEGQSEDSPFEMDISKGNIKITSDYIEYGGVKYSPNTNGYVIKGSTTEHNIEVDLSDDFDGEGLEDITIPPITFKDLNVSLEDGLPLLTNFGMDITVEGECNLTSANSQAVNINNDYDLPSVNVNITGSGLLNIHSNKSNALAVADNSKITITGTGAAVTTDAALNAITGTGQFVTDSQTRMQITTNGTPEVQPVNSEGTPLYQLAANFNAEDKTATECTYNNKTYHVGSDNVLYLMLPNGEYDITDVIYNNNIYDGSVTINNAPETIDLATVYVTDVTMDLNGNIPCEGAVVNFDVTGYRVADNVTIRLKPNRDWAENVEAVVKEKDGKNIAAVTVPENTNTDNSITYEVYYVIFGQETKTDLKVTIVRNNTQCSITKFVLQYQVGEAEIIEESKRINVTMPYDDPYISQNDPNGKTPATKYVPVTIEHTGNIVTPVIDEPVEFFYDISGKLRKEFTVIAKDGKTKSTYKVWLTKQAVPRITKMESSADSLTGSGGKVDITLSGTNLANIINAEQENNRKVFVYADGENSIEPVEAVKNENGNYEVSITIPENDDYDEAKEYKLQVKIGDVVQTSSASQKTITVERKLKNSTGIKSFTIDGQIGPTSQSDATSLTIIMPYDADLTNLSPDIVLDDSNASYSPENVTDFSKPVQYTVTADNRIDTAVYTVTVLKQPAPKITDVEFTNPLTSAGGNVQFTLSGQNLDSIENAISGGEIVVKCTPKGEGNTVSGVAEKQDDKYTVKLTIPKNDSIEAAAEYVVSIEIDGEEQTLTGGNPTLTVPIKKSDACDIVDFKLTDNQSELNIGEDTITLKVPYNTNLRSLKPEIMHTGTKCEPDEAKDFTSAVQYTVTAENGNTKEYTVTVLRDGSAGISDATFTNPTTSKAGKVTVTVTGNFVNDIGDTLVVTATSQGGGDAINAEIEYTEYGGKATAVLTLPKNLSESEQKYTVSVMLNGVEQTISNNEITVPGKRRCAITSFTVEGQLDETEIVESDDGNTITFKVPYFYDLTAVVPSIEYEAETISPAADEPQDFSDSEKPVTYTLKSGGDTEVYTVRAELVGKKPSINKFTVEKQSGDTVYDGNTITITMPSNANLKKIQPIIEFDGESYSPQGEQDFSKSDKIPVIYTVVDQYGKTTEYEVKITKKRHSSKKDDETPIPTPTPTPTPSATPSPVPTDKANVKPYMSGYDENGEVFFKPESKISRAEVAKVLSVLDNDFDNGIEYPNVFDDIDENAWYRNYVNFAVSKGYMSGYDDGTILPYNMITRAEFVSMIARYMNISPSDGEDRFNDIEDFYWCRQQINALADKGIVCGYGDNVFMPNNYITRAEAVSIFNRMLGREITSEIMSKLECPFSDVTSGHWAYNDILLASCEY